MDRSIDELLSESETFRLLAVATGLFLLSACTAIATVQSPQLGCSFVILSSVMALYWRSPHAGLWALWIVWLLSPGLRRVFGLATGYIDSDPLALTPFAATLAIALIALSRIRLSRRALRVLGCATGGLLLGIPVGIGNPPAAAFALVAYTAGVSALVLGYAIARSRPEGPASLSGALRRLAPPIAVYAILQSTSPLLPWDELWIDSVDLTTIGSVQGGDLRVFGTLNSPGTLAMVLGLTLLSIFALERSIVQVCVAAAPVLGALGLTSARSAWLAFVPALVVLLAADRGRAAARAGAVVIGVVVLLLVVGPSTPVGSSVLNRAGTLGDLQGDTSAQERVATLDLVPVLIATPLGNGIGSAGEASRLSATQTLRATDNAYLSLLYQLGPLGFLLVLTAVAAALRPLRILLGQRERRRETALLASWLVFLLIVGLSGDVFYGVTGVILWFTVGVALGRAESVASTEPLRRLN